jgi:hypothetical protein
LVEFPQNGFGTSEKKIRENPEEIFKMVRATLRGLMFIWDKKNQDQVLDVNHERDEADHPANGQRIVRTGYAGDHEGWFRKARLHSGAHRSRAGKHQGDPAGPGKPSRRLLVFGKTPKGAGIEIGKNSLNLAGRLCLRLFSFILVSQEFVKAITKKHLQR